jgi:secreted trypsin-like serine protease
VLAKRALRAQDDLAMLTLLTLLLPLAATADERYPAIVNGTPTSEPEAVAALTVAYDGQLYGPFCSATLISDTWALTAAHCIHAMQDDYAGQDVYLVTGGDLFEDGIDKQVKVERGIPHPDYDDSTYTDDIGLLELQGVGLLSVAPIPLNNDPVTAEWIDEELRFVGYGITSDAAQDMGVKRYADIPIVNTDLEIIYAWDPDDGQNVCQGDSGGAALEVLGSGNYELAGVNAFVGLWKGQEGDRPCVDGFVGATRVDVHLDWIEAQTGGSIITDTGYTSGTSPWGGKGGGGWCAAAPVSAWGLGVLLLSLGTAVTRRRDQG